MDSSLFCAVGGKTCYFTWFKMHEILKRLMHYTAHIYIPDTFILYIQTKALTDVLMRVAQVDFP